MQLMVGAVRFGMWKEGEHLHFIIQNCWKSRSYQELAGLKMGIAHRMSFAKFTVLLIRDGAEHGCGLQYFSGWI